MKKFLTPMICILLCVGLCGCTKVAKGTEKDTSLGTLPAALTTTSVQATTEATQNGLPNDSQAATTTVSSSDTQNIQLKSAGIQFPIPSDWQIVSCSYTSTVLANSDKTQFLSVSTITQMVAFVDDADVLWTMMRLNIGTVQVEANDSLAQMVDFIDDPSKPILENEENAISPLISRAYGIGKYPIYDPAANATTTKDIPCLIYNFGQQHDQFVFTFSALAGDSSDLYDLAESVVANTTNIPDSAYDLSQVATSTFTGAALSFSYPANLTSTPTFQMTRLADDTVDVMSEYSGLRIVEIESYTGTADTASVGEYLRQYLTFALVRPDQMFSIGDAGGKATIMITKDPEQITGGSKMILQQDFYFSVPLNSDVAATLYDGGGLNVYGTYLQYESAGKVYLIVFMSPAAAKAARESCIDLVLRDISYLA